MKEWIQNPKVKKLILDDMATVGKEAQVNTRPSIQIKLLSFFSLFLNFFHMSHDSSDC